MGAWARATGYKGSFSPAPNLDDDAVRHRSLDGADASPHTSAARSLASTAEVPPATPEVPTNEPNLPSPPPMFGPLVHNLNKAPRIRSNAADAERATQWVAADRRNLGGFDARFHSTGAYVS
jgi:hypothetical protein